MRTKTWSGPKMGPRTKDAAKNNWVFKENCSNIYIKVFKEEISQLKRSFFLKRLCYTYVRWCQSDSVFQRHLNFANSKYQDSSRTCNMRPNYLFSILLHVKFAKLGYFWQGWGLVSLNWHPLTYVLAPSCVQRVRSDD